MPSQCMCCRHARQGAFCDAFPEQIPDDILMNRADHRLPYPGDHGIRFEERPNRPRSELCASILAKLDSLHG